MIALLLAFLIAIGHGATAMRLPSPADVAPEVFEGGPAVFLEWEGPGCPTFGADEPCYVLVQSDLRYLEVGRP